MRRYRGIYWEEARAYAILKNFVAYTDRDVSSRGHRTYAPGEIYVELEHWSETMGKAGGGPFGGSKSDNWRISLKEFLFEWKFADSEKLSPRKWKPVESIGTVSDIIALAPVVEETRIQRKRGEPVEVEVTPEVEDWKMEGGG